MQKRNKIDFIIMFFVSIFMIAGCARGTEKDSWYTNPNIKHSKLLEFGWIKTSDFFLVSKEMQKEAINKLSNIPLVKLDKDNFIRYGGLEANYKNNNSYLSRSLVFYSNVEGYEVYINNDSAIIFHGSLGGKLVPMRKQAIVIQSKEEINSIFVYCSQAR